jgi:hypothetical protein
MTINTKTLTLADTTLQLIQEVRKRKPWFADESDDGIIFHILTEWLNKDGEQSLNEWIREMF